MEVHLITPSQAADLMEQRPGFRQYNIGSMKVSLFGEGAPDTVLVEGVNGEFAKVTNPPRE